LKNGKNAPEVLLDERAERVVHEQEAMARPIAPPIAPSTRLLRG
jgi:hypothetical protein